MSNLWIIQGEVGRKEKVITREVVTDGTLDESLLTLKTVDVVASHGPYGNGFVEPAFDGMLR